MADCNQAVVQITGCGYYLFRVCAALVTIPAGNLSLTSLCQESAC